MVLCKYFLQGNCRFGNKCHNDHFDIKQLLKTDAEGAINGKQWPFSCYGPFKDKKCIPNLVEDQSFEEIRLMCYEAKQKNYFEQFHQQFTKEALEATNKMRILTQCPPEVVDLVAKIYDSLPDSNLSTNPLGFSMFNKTNNTSSAGGIFGGTNNPFQSQQTIFGSSSANQLQQQQQQNIFGTSTNNQVAGNLFVGSLNAQQPNNLFGSTQQSSVFGQPNQQSQGFGFVNNAVQSGGNIFTQQPTNAAITSPFNQQQNTAVGATNPSQGLFSQTLQQRSPQQSLFTPFQTNVQTPFGANPVVGGNIFQQSPPQQQQQPQLSMLQTTQNGGLFNQNIGGIPGQMGAVQHNSANNFGAFNRFTNQPDQQQQQQQNIFQQQNPPSMFPFQNSQQTEQQQQQQQQQFLQQQALQQQQNLQQQQQQLVLQQQQQQVFQQQTLEAHAQQQQQQQQEMVQQQQQQQLQQQIQLEQQRAAQTITNGNDTRYSQMEAINEEDMQKFNSKNFTADGTPLCLPPKELC